jgi:mono/diheme cytochrome c family protein
MTRHVLISSLCGMAACAAAEPGETIYQRGYLSIEEAHRSIELQDGYSLELVLSDPDIKEPVACAFDGNGVLYVVEMLTYMQTADADGEQEPKSRISRHEDTDGDGIYDRHSVFIDNLLLPRMVLPLDDRVMVGVTNTLDLWNYRDSDGDGVADEKIKIFEGGHRGGNMEHQPSGLIWALDNWIYITYENQRYRFTDGKLEVERIPRGGGQWGLTQDDWGRLYYSAAGGENPAFGFQQPPVYGMLDLPNQTSPDFRRVFPIAEIPDVQGGRPRVGPNGGLNHMTGCAGQEIFRGDRLPEDLRGDLLIPEPVGRMVRRAKLERRDALTYLTNAYPESEFIRTRDANFRPLWAKTAPDGRMLLVDMHRGIIQQGNWTQPGSYLRGIIDKWGLDKNIGKGRIYRLVHKDFPPGPQPRMLDESTADLVKHLSHPNGWWRDTAQKLIILRNNRDSVVPALKELVRNGSSELGRAHALWTLEGIGAADAETVSAALADPSTMVKVQALRVGEALLHEGDSEVIAAVLRLSEDLGAANAELITQLLNSVARSGATDQALLERAAATGRAFQQIPAVAAVLAMAESNRAEAVAAAERRKANAALANAMDRGKTIYTQLCYTCHGADGTGTEMPDNPGLMLGPSLVGSPRVLGNGGSLVRTILHGMTGPMDGGKSYPGQMVPMASQDDEWIANVASYIRNDFGNQAPPIDPAFVAAIRNDFAGRTTPWTLEELEALEPPDLTNRHEWKFQASHNSGNCRAMVDGNAGSRWDTGTSQRGGEWLQIELPKVSKVGELILDTRGSDRDYPRGYEVTVSLDGKNWSEPVARGMGTNPVTSIGLPMPEAKFIRINQTGAVNGLYWSIHELRIKGKEL